MNTQDAVNRTIADMPFRVPFEMTTDQWLPHVAWQAGYTDALNMVLFFAKNLEEASPEKAERLRVAAQAVLNAPLILTKEQHANAVSRQNSLLTE